MIKFLFTGIRRDKNRSLLPIIVVSIGVFLTVVMSSWISGIIGDMTDLNARFNTGHVKVVTRAYAEDIEQSPNDLAILNSSMLLASLNQDYPDMEWVERIRFAGLLDIADEQGETKAQGPASGQAIDLLSPNSSEVERLNIQKALVSGSLPQKQGEALISHDFAKKFELKQGSEITLFCSTMYGSMSFKNFIISGTVRFGAQVLDKGTILIDIKDAQSSLDMEDAAGEILGYFKKGGYKSEKAEALKKTFNQQYTSTTDEYAPIMLQLKDQNQLASYLDYVDMMSGLMVFIFVFAMSVVLWNTGLIGGLRRYNEFGLRLALGEEKKHIYRTIIYESLLIGFVGSLLGTGMGLFAAYLLQEIGIDFSAVLKDVSMMIPTIYRASITPESFYIGFIPGLFSTVLGAALAGIGIYKRKTSLLSTPRL